MVERKRKRWGVLLCIPLPVSLCFGLTFLSLTLLFLFVDLKPKVDENFFFSSQDPQFRQDRIISDIFPQPPQIILSAKGDLHSPAYLEKIRKLSEALAALKEVFSVQSLTHGPENLHDALESPLWKRMLRSEDDASSFISVFIKELSAEEVIPKIERIRDEIQGPEFQVMISGAPYIIELIRRNLAKDLLVFSLAALGVFSLVLFAIFRSLPLLLGTLVACLNSSALTLLLTRILDIPIGPLTANLTTMVFVLTLSPIVFLTFNWKHLIKEKGGTYPGLTRDALRWTIGGSFWSMATTFLGFLTLLFVQATPLKQLGISGSIGTFIAFAAAYLIYPWFLPRGTPAPSGEVPILTEVKETFFRRRHGLIVAAVIALSLAASFGLRDLNTDPDSFTYFKRGSELRNGLEYIDKNGGSNPLRLVVVDQDRAPFTSGEAYRKLWGLHQALEADPAVGNVVSLPIILAEARSSPLTFLLSKEWLLKLLETERFGEIAKYFITEDREKTFFLLRMREGVRDISRVRIVERVKEIAAREGLAPVLVGGVYLLQGKLSELLTSSLISGLGLLITLFVFMGWMLSRSLRVTLAMCASLALIPVLMLGLMGHFRIPLDVISAPSANLAIGMGVDAMIYMVFFVRRFRREEAGSWKRWGEACSELCRPIACNLVVISSGFGIFILSNFPPTQRFGLSVAAGSLLAALAALFILPWFATLEMRKGNLVPKILSDN